MDPITSFQGPSLYPDQSPLYFPSLLTQRGWRVQDTSQVNFRTVFSTIEAGEGYTEEVLVQDELLFPITHWGDQGWEVETEARTFLSQAFQPLGDEVYFTFRGYNTFLYFQEYELVKDYLEKVYQITIDVRGSIPYRTTTITAILLP